MVARGLREPLLIVTDGNPGVLKAIEEVFPQSLHEILESFHAKSFFLSRHSTAR